MKGIADLIRSGKSVGFRRFGLIDKPEGWPATGLYDLCGTSCSCPLSIHEGDFGVLASLSAFPAFSP